MHPIDWAIVLSYVAFALFAGVKLAKRAGSDVDEYFLSGRSLAWWLTGTSMVATSFAADTPLVVTGWVRDHGIWKNWAWWCFAISGVVQVFLFAPLWRRGNVMTKAELSELRYGGRGARLLRATLGALHAGVTNNLILCWVLLAAGKILDTLLGIDQTLGLVIASLLALTYSLLAGFWGVVVTDVVQFTMAMIGGISLAAIAWHAVGSADAVHEAVAGGLLSADVVRFLPAAGTASVFGPGFWTSAVAATCVYLGVSWWAVENVDGSTIAVQRISASKDERHGMLATLWFNVVHYAVRPWCWIPVALASLLVLPTEEHVSPGAGVVERVDREAIVLRLDAPLAEERVVPLAEGPDDAWFPQALVEPGERVDAGTLIARTDSERAYVAMMRRYLPVGLLGLVVASLLAAFMSTIDTHVNLAASFFVNDLYRRFLRPQASASHYVAVARVASAVALALAGWMASMADSISELFLFFLAFLSGVGPVYVLRWVWWRVTASTEIAAMLASAITTSLVKVLQVREYVFPDTPLSPGGVLGAEGRLLCTVTVSLVVTLLALLVTRPPDPASLVPFYRRVRPLGAWGPVRALAPDVVSGLRLPTVVAGTLGGLLTTYGAMLGIGFALLEQGAACAIAAGATVCGVFLLRGALRR